MPVRTYLPTLKFFLERTCKFIAEHRVRILEVIGSEHESELNAVVSACNTLVAILILFIETGT